MTISGGNNFGAMICGDGQVATWGKDPGSGTIYNSPTMVSIASGLSFQQITAGSGSHIVALSCVGTVYAWGESNEGQCGSFSSRVATPQLIPKVTGTAGYDEDGNPGGDYLGDVKFVAASSSGSFALLNDGKVVGWGGNVTGGGTGKGKWIAANTTTPVYITYLNGAPVEHVVHIAGGDNNILITVDEDGDGLGELYSLGSWNGRGGGEAEIAVFAEPVLKGDPNNPTVAINPAEPLINIRMSGLMDVGGFAVDADGYVWGWGNQGWNGAAGTGGNISHGYAAKVVSGAYKEISGEDYLTDIKEVVGGNGHGMAVTKEGYVVAWGGNKVFESKTDNTKIGPIFLSYCGGGRVTNAVHIARGDNFGYMVNENNEYFTIGIATGGELGTGTNKITSYCFMPINLNVSCPPMAPAPEAFMLPKYTKCPDENLTLHSEFVTPTGKADDYYFTWYHNGERLNSSAKESNVADRRADYWNQTNPQVTEEGVYKVVVEYIGANGPCATFPADSAQTTVSFNEMPITPVETMVCFDNPLEPDEVCFEFISKYEDEREFDIYPSATGGAALGTITVPALGTGLFCIAGTDVSVVEDGEDVYYDIYVEDKASDIGTLLGEAPCNSPSGGMNKNYNHYLFVTAYERVLLESLDINVTAGSGIVSAIIYGSKQNAAKTALVADVTQIIHTGAPITISSTGTITLPINFEWQGSERGISYFIGLKVVSGKPTIFDNYNCTLPQWDNLGSTLSANYTDMYAGTKALQSKLITNIQFTKLSSYDCGRMKLRAKSDCCEHSLVHNSEKGSKSQLDKEENNPIHEIEFFFGNGAESVEFNPPLPTGMNYDVNTDTEPYRVRINGIHPLHIEGAQPAYVITTTGSDGCTCKSDLIVFSVIPLPVELTQFKAQALTETILVQWETQTETNNEHFTLLRSKQGSQFEAIARIAGAGTTTAMQHYSFTDTKPYAGISYYRLAQTDFNGTTTLHHIIPVNFSPALKNFTVANSSSNGITTLQ
ncbi:MAG: hypothetical protein LBR55_05310, partial [Bacteroidales bacterium]|nr:hypothetical protein [Bacteroidales bacterium]